MANPSHLWQGESGKEYEYQIVPINDDLRDAPGNYIFAMKKGGKWEPIYIGQTSSLRDRLVNHEIEKSARDKGATHIHAHLSGGEEERRTEEADLIRKHKPPLNSQLK
ncbi:MAG: GIY-YIG nuclease family protein [Candidatus Sumerlaeota bacterium]|nr:GIY-YIG nuclease family protein [Candidatus Sumerlaeota bacterium]